MPADDSRTRFNLADWLVTRHVREGRGSSVAVLADDVPLTYAAIEALSNQAGQAFRSLGLAPEQRVVLVLHDSPAFYAAFLGAIKIGGIPVPVNTLLRQADYAYLLQDSRAVLVVVSEALLPEVLPIVHLAGRLRHVLVAGEGRGPLLSFDALIVGPARARSTPPTPLPTSRRSGCTAQEAPGCRRASSTFSAMRWRRSKATRGACWA